MTPTTYIALIDDHVLMRSSLSTLINSFDGYKVILEADHGKDFIEKLKPRSAPDIILLDITMPEMNGYETADWIRINLPDSKVLVLSMLDSDSAIIRIIKAGAKGYILKDSKPGMFRDALNSVRDHGFFMNELVSSRMLHYMNNIDQHAKGKDNTIHFTDREIHFMKLACSDKSYKEIADEMYISSRTVESYRDSLLQKLGVSSRVGIVLYAIKHGIFKP